MARREGRNFSISFRREGNTEISVTKIACVGQIVNCIHHLPAWTFGTFEYHSVAGTTPNQLEFQRGIQSLHSVE